MISLISPNLYLAASSLAGIMKALKDFFATFKGFIDSVLNFFVFTGNFIKTIIESVNALAVIIIDTFAASQMLMMLPGLFSILIMFFFARIAIRIFIDLL